jgi:RHS repeat-associated protein
MAIRQSEQRDLLLFFVSTRLGQSFTPGQGKISPRFGLPTEVASPYYYRARYYDPSAGRFVSEDPIGFVLGTNFYRYAVNSPTTLIDPTGLAPHKKCCPTADEKKILSMAEDAQDKLNQMAQTGTFIPKTGQVLGSTICIAGQANISIPSSLDDEPCIYKCVLEHEQVHAKMCATMGLRYYDLTFAQKETPAFTKELGCYLRMLLENGLGPYRPYWPYRSR